MAIVKLILERGVDLQFKNEKGHTIQAVNSRNLKVFDYLLDRSDISQSEKIVALELAGAVIIGDFHYTSPRLITRAYKYWRQSLHLREEECSQKNDGTTDTDGQGIQSFLVKLRIFSTLS